MIGGLSHPSRKLKHFRTRLIARAITVSFTHPVTSSFSRRVKSPPQNVPNTVVTSFSGPAMQEKCHARIHRGWGQGVRTHPPENHKAIGVHNNTGPDPLKITKLSSEH